MVLKYDSMMKMNAESVKMIPWWSLFIIIPATLGLGAAFVLLMLAREWYKNNPFG